VAEIRAGFARLCAEHQPQHVGWLTGTSIHRPLRLVCDTAAPFHEPERWLAAGFRVRECQKPATDRRSSKLVQRFNARTFVWENSHPSLLSAVW